MDQHATKDSVNVGQNLTFSFRCDGWDSYTPLVDLDGLLSPLARRVGFNVAYHRFLSNKSSVRLSRRIPRIASISVPELSAFGAGYESHQPGLNCSTGREDLVNYDDRRTTRGNHHVNGSIPGAALVHLEREEVLALVDSIIGILPGVESGYFSWRSGNDPFLHREWNVTRDGKLSGFGWRTVVNEELFGLLDPGEVQSSELRVFQMECQDSSVFVMDLPVPPVVPGDGAKQVESEVREEDGRGIFESLLHDYFRSDDFVASQRYQSSGPGFIPSTSYEQSHFEGKEIRVVLVDPGASGEEVDSIVFPADEVFVVVETLRCFKWSVETDVWLTSEMLRHAIDTIDERSGKELIVRLWNGGKFRHLYDTDENERKTIALADEVQARLVPFMEAAVEAGLGIVVDSEALPPLRRFWSEDSAIRKNLSSY